MSKLEYVLFAVFCGIIAAAVTAGFMTPKPPRYKVECYGGYQFVTGLRFDSPQQLIDENGHGVKCQ